MLRDGLSAVGRQRHVIKGDLNLTSNSQGTGIKAEDFFLAGAQRKMLCHALNLQGTKFPLTSD